MIGEGEDDESEEDLFKNKWNPNKPRAGAWQQDVIQLMLNIDDYAMLMNVKSPLNKVFKTIEIKKNVIECNKTYSVILSVCSTLCSLGPNIFLVRDFICFQFCI